MDTKLMVRVKVVIMIVLDVVQLVSSECNLILDVVKVTVVKNLVVF
jgi:hypothetical protein